ncbi:MAG: leucyl/phenylalanyl-tRNA--protein transferase [Synechococcaceae cyanobacterium SM2_3_1]|nr:leucyl/phenylalanyl-tRNA--protein transferase [Synechococcaceae cyanobacterium SM2_3_1]
MKELDIDISMILKGYAQGYFLMAGDDDKTLHWFNSRQRTLIPLDHRFHCPRSLKTLLNKGIFTPAIDRAFTEVMEGCASRVPTWINADLKRIYLALHEAGWAHSFETWQGDQLAGGILGIAMGGVFIGESMFYAIPDGSKVAMVNLVEHLRQRGFLLFDAQLPNPHLSRFGAVTISGSDYLELLQKALQCRCQFT